MPLLACFSKKGRVPKGEKERKKREEGKIAGLLQLVPS